MEEQLPEIRFQVEKSKELSIIDFKSPLDVSILNISQEIENISGIKPELEFFYSFEEVMYYNPTFFAMAYVYYVQLNGENLFPLQDELIKRYLKVINKDKYPNKSELYINYKLEIAIYLQLLINKLKK